jgi:hypothetical protein
MHAAARLKERVVSTVAGFLAQGMGFSSEPSEDERSDLFDGNLTLLVRLVFLLYA